MTAPAGQCDPVTRLNQRGRRPAIEMSPTKIHTRKNITAAAKMERFEEHKKQSSEWTDLQALFRPGVSWQFNANASRVLNRK
jgi:hypothetical protein